MCGLKQCNAKIDFETVSHRSLKGRLRTYYCPPWRYFIEKVFGRCDILE